MQFVRKNRNKSYKKKKKRLSLRVIIAGFVFLIIGLAVFRFVQSARHSLLLRNDRVGIVINTDPIVFLFFNRKSDQITGVSIPADAYVELTRGFGSYRISSAWKLGEIEGVNGKLLAEATQELIGVPVDIWVGWSVDPEVIDKSSYIFELRKRLLPIFSESTGKISSNMGYLDRFAVAMILYKTPQEKVEWIDISSTDAVSDLELADGEKVSVIDVERLDVFIESRFESEDIRGEGFTIEVLNGTKRPFIGQRIARLITNMGAKVVRVGNSQKLETDCIVYAQESIKKSKTIKEIINVFDCSFIEKSEEKREDIQVVIGSSYADTLFKKYE